MQRYQYAALCSTALLGLAIVVLPDQFLFSKTVPNSFWTEYFPLPFGAGWFITFIALGPVIWCTKALSGALKSAGSVTLVSILMAVPISLLMGGGTLSVNNLLYQYLWLGIICLPPLILHAVLRLIYGYFAKKWLDKREGANISKF